MQDFDGRATIIAKFNHDISISYALIRGIRSGGLCCQPAQRGCMLSSTAIEGRLTTVASLLCFTFILLPTLFQEADCKILGLVANEVKLRQNELDLFYQLASTR